MVKAIQVVVCFAVLVTAGSVAAVAYRACAALEQWGGAGTSTRQAAIRLDAALARLNAPHGTIAMADEDLGAIKSLVVHGDLVARHEQQQLGKIDGYAAEIVSELRAATTSVTLAATAGKESAQAATLAIGTANVAIAGVVPLEGQLVQTAKDADQSLVSLTPPVRALLASSGDVTANAAAILADGKRISDKAAFDYLNPKPWYAKLRGYAGDGFDIAAFFARHY